METKLSNLDIIIMTYPELNELESVGGDIRDRIELFFVNSNFDETQRKVIVDLLNEFYTIGLVDGLSGASE
jgi:hypothetical protein